MKARIPGTSSVNSNNTDNAVSLLKDGTRLDIFFSLDDGHSRYRGKFGRTTSPFFCVAESIAEPGVPF